VKACPGIWLVLFVQAIAGCGLEYDHTIARVDGETVSLEVIERYRRAAFSGHTLDSRIVLVVRSGPFSWKRREIDVSEIDTIDLTSMERALSADKRWRALSPHDRASRRVFFPQAMGGGSLGRLRSTGRNGVPVPR
jgi:hypothetical protein